MAVATFSPFVVMGARYSMVLAALFLAGACVNSTSRERAGIEALAAAEVPKRGFCVDLPIDDLAVGTNGERARISAEWVDLPGSSGRDGVARYPGMEALRRTYDLLADLGLYTVENDLSSAADGLIWRSYRRSPLGETHLRDVARHGQSSLALLCYGKRRLIGIRSVGPTYRKSRCAQGRSVSYTYVYEDLPAWVEDARLRESFPDLVTSRNAAELRDGSLMLTGSSREWYVDHSGPGPTFVVC
jgi:hypothetical protein